MSIGASVTQVWFPLPLIFYNMFQLPGLIYFLEKSFQAYSLSLS